MAQPKPAVEPAPKKQDKPEAKNPESLKKDDNWGLKFKKLEQSEDIWGSADPSKDESAPIKKPVE